jgi:hypothetical protein
MDQIYGGLPAPARCHQTSIVDKEKPRGVPLTGEGLKGVDRESFGLVVTRDDYDR